MGRTRDLKHEREYLGKKKMTNVRAAASDDTVRLTPPRILSLEQALEFIATDECIEVTPETIRMRKTILELQIERETQSSKQTMPYSS